MNGPTLNLGHFVRSRKQEIHSRANLSHKLYMAGDKSTQPQSGFQHPPTPGATTTSTKTAPAGAGTHSPEALVLARLLRANAAALGYGVSRPGVWKRGPRAPALRPCSTPPNGFLSRLPLNSVGAGGSAAGKEASTEMPEPREGPQRRDRSSQAEKELTFSGEGRPWEYSPQRLQGVQHVPLHRRFGTRLRPSHGPSAQSCSPL